MTRQSKTSARLPRPARVLAKRILRRQRPVWWGNLRRRRPFSDDWGVDRGLPVDRFYIENFVALSADAIRGRVLEVAEPLYTRRFGGEHVTSSGVVDIDASNETAVFSLLACARARKSAA